jgi:hypothetical protein
MKDGDFVICNNFDAFKFKSVTLTNNTFYEEYKLDGLTIGKKYELLAYIDFSDTVVIVNDYGSRYYYSSKNFVLIDDYREEQINKILNN